MLTIIGLIILGMAVIVVGGLLLQLAANIDFFPLTLLVGLIATIVIVVGIMIPFIPLMNSSSENETLNMKACKNIGGKYEVIDQTWNGKFYTDVYGCIKK